MTVLIPISRGEVTIVDDEDAGLAQFRWSAHPIQRASGGYYVSRHAAGDEPGSTIYMHRTILHAPPGMLVDHINGNGLDNRRSNLRLCTKRQNAINRRYERLSGARGVEAHRNTWRVVFTNEGIAYSMSGFPTREMAARAYDALAKEFHGEFAILNFGRAA